jgi:hypothetical protein
LLGRIRFFLTKVPVPVPQSPTVLLLRLCYGRFKTVLPVPVPVTQNPGLLSAAGSGGRLMLHADGIANLFYLLGSDKFCLINVL